MKRVFLMVSVLAILILSINFLVGGQLANAQTKLTKEDILKKLNSPGFSKEEANEYLIGKVKQLGVSFEFTADVEKELTENGASIDLINAIKEKSPKPTPLLTPIQTPTPEITTPTPPPTPISTPTPEITTPTPTPTSSSSGGRLTKEKVFIVLDNKDLPIGEINKRLVSIVKQRGVNFDVTPAIEKELKAHRANAFSIKTIIENSPSGAVSNTVSIPVIKNSIGMELVEIPAGDFMMGTKINRKFLTKDIDTIESQEDSYLKDVSQEDETPTRKITFKSSFYMGKYEVTQEQWEKLMGMDIRKFRDTYIDQNYHKDNDFKLYGVGPNYPMYYISWRDAKDFITKLNSIDTEFEYNLPSEAQWEYAAGARTQGDYPGLLDDIAWYANNSGIEIKDTDENVKLLETFQSVNKNQAHPVGTKKPNGFGLYDMQGNVSEWCEDVYNSSYEGLPTTDGSANSLRGDQTRIFRGGSWMDSSKYLRSAWRNKFFPPNRFPFMGFRVVARRK